MSRELPPQDNSFSNPQEFGFTDDIATAEDIQARIYAQFDFILDSQKAGIPLKKEWREYMLKHQDEIALYQRRQQENH